MTIRDGDLVVIKSGNNENGHIGFVKDIPVLCWA
jgi:hypothetical protein